MTKGITYREFYQKVFSQLPDFEKLQVLKDWKDDIDEGYAATVIMSDMAREMMKLADNGDLKSTDKLLTIIEDTFKNYPDSSVVAFIGTDFIVSLLEYPMTKDLKEKIKAKMGDRTLEAYKISKRGYQEVFK